MQPLSQAHTHPSSRHSLSCPRCSFVPGPNPIGERWSFPCQPRVHLKSTPLGKAQSCAPGSADGAAEAEEPQSEHSMTVRIRLFHRYSSGSVMTQVRAASIAASSAVMLLHTRHAGTSFSSSQFSRSSQCSRRHLLSSAKLSRAVGLGPDGGIWIHRGYGHWPRRRWLSSRQVGRLF